MVAWRKLLTGAPTTLELPVDHVWPLHRTAVLRTASIDLGGDDAIGVGSLAERHGTTEFIVVLTAVQLALSRWTGQPDFLVGTDVSSCAGSAATELTTGAPSSDLLPLRARIDETSTFAQLLKTTRTMVDEAAALTAIPFHRIADELGARRIAQRHRLVQVRVTKDFRQDAADEEGTGRSAPLDLDLRYQASHERGSQLVARYPGDIFEPDTIHAFLRRLRLVLQTASEQPDALLHSTPALTPPEADQVKAWGQGDPPSAYTGSVDQQVRAQAATHPHREAVYVAGTSRSFSELAVEMGQVAALLRRHGVGPRDPVGTLLGRSPALVSGTLGVLSAGAYYVPLDPAYPADRLRFMLEDCGASVVLHDASGPLPAELASYTGAKFVDIADAAHLEPAELTEVASSDLAYAMYTSGTAGAPKAVHVTHAGVANLLSGLERIGAVGEGVDRVGWNASPSFDASVQQWVRLGRGDTLVVLGDLDRLDPDRLAEVVRSQRITHLDITPTHLEAMLERLVEVADEHAALCLLVGGEPIGPGLWRRLAALGVAGRLTSFNMYGPTETTVDATATRITGDSPHLGLPLPGVTVSVVDSDLRRVPPGTAGELLIEGVGVARGYGRRPELTAKAFVAALGSPEGSRAYRSGDRVRWSRDGFLEHLGRMDRQVKLRGFRIELDEIETAIANLPGVGSVVAAIRDLPGGPGLVAYCSRAGQGALDFQWIRRQASQRLPAHMVPELVYEVDRFPLGPGGKVDITQLPSAPLATDRQVTSPQSPMERLVAEIWTDVVGVQHVSATDSFLDLGGHSMHATRVVSALRKRLGLPLPVTVVFQFPRLRGLAQHLESIVGEFDSGADTAARIETTAI